MTAPDLSQIIASIGEDVRFRESRTMLGGTQWACIVPCGASRAFVASGRTPMEALLAVKAIIGEFEDEDLSGVLEESIAAAQAAKGGAR